MPPCPQWAVVRQRLFLIFLVSWSLPCVGTAFLHGTSRVACLQDRHARPNIASSTRSDTYTRKYRRRTGCRDRAVCSSSMSAVSRVQKQQHEGDDPDEEPSSPTATDGSTSGDGVSSVVDAKTVTAAREAEATDAPGEDGSNKQRRARGLWGWRSSERRRDEGEEKEEDDEKEKAEKEKKEKKAGAFTYDWDNGSRIVWAAAKTSSVDVEEGGRKLKDYLALPPTEYSLLDPKMITRLSEETFRMDGATMNIVGTKIQPVIFVKVEVQPEHSMANILVERVELEGSDAVRSAGGSFNVSSSTVVSCTEKEGSGRAHLKVLRTTSKIEIELLVPNENFVPLGVLRRAGNFVMQRVVDIGVPQFTKFLKRDYARWTEGNDDRAAVVLEGEALIEPGDT